MTLLETLPTFVIYEKQNLLSVSTKKILKIEYKFSTQLYKYLSFFVSFNYISQKRYHLISLTCYCIFLLKKVLKCKRVYTLLAIFSGSYFDFADTSLHTTLCGKEKRPCFTLHLYNEE